MQLYPQPADAITFRFSFTKNLPTHFNRPTEILVLIPTRNNSIALSLPSTTLLFNQSSPTITLGRKSSGCGSLGPHETLLYPRRTFGEDVTCEGISVYIPGFGSAEVLVSLSVVLVSAEDVVDSSPSVKRHLHCTHPSNVTPSNRTNKTILRLPPSKPAKKPLNNPPLPKKQHKKGLEASLFQSLQSQDGESAKSLLAQYGIAYLATSIQLAILSFAVLRVVGQSGVDVGRLDESYSICAFGAVGGGGGE
ncbi:hypothetical protein HJC23_003684, partial [Cyclotella cryptica]